jgi:hypothetical protein
MSITGFSHRHFVDPGTGKTKRIYKYNGKPCQAVVHTSQKAKQLSGYVLIEKDIRNCLAWLDEIETRNDEGATDQGIRSYEGKDRANYTIIKGLFVALLTFYAKCFTSCEGRKIKLDKSKLDSEFHQIHEHLMILRHNFAAHSGAELIEMARVVTLFSPIKKGKFKAQTIKELEQPDLLVTKPGDKSMRELLLHTKAIVDAKIQLLSQSIEAEEVPQIAMRMTGGS